MASADDFTSLYIVVFTYLRSPSSSFLRGITDESGSQTSDHSLRFAFRAIVKEIVVLSLWDIDGASSEFEAATDEPPTPPALPETDSAETSEDVSNVDESETIGKIVDSGSGCSN